MVSFLEGFPWTPSWIKCPLFSPSQHCVYPQLSLPTFSWSDTCIYISVSSTGQGLLEWRDLLYSLLLSQFLEQGLLHNACSVNFDWTEFKIFWGSESLRVLCEICSVLRKLNNGFSWGQFPGREKTWAVPWRVRCVGFELIEKREGYHQAELNQQRWEGTWGGQYRNNARQLLRFWCAAVGNGLEQVELA